jgi:hypothetical protein
LILLAVASLALAATAASAQKETQAARASNAASARQPTSTDAGDVPPFQDYKGVRLGMDAGEVRKKLGNPQDKSDQQDLYLFSDKESAQVFYDASKKVSALAITYLGDVSRAPSAQTVFGTQIEAKADGSVYKMERYPKAGYWLSYSRTGGEEPMVSVTMQKIN